MQSSEDESVSSDSFPQYAQIQQPFGCDPPVVHCPICGNPTLEIDENGMEELTPCPHLAFIFTGTTEEFAYMSDDFIRKCGFTDFQSEEETIEELLIKAGYRDNMLALEITYGGMGGGPVWFTDVYGFDYETLIPKDVIRRFSIV